MIAFYISGHGFGHASRDIEVLNALGSLAPHVPVAVRTSAPRWLFDLTLTRPIEWHPLECDTGVVQIDSLRLDEQATVDRASAFHDDLDAKAAVEARWLQSMGAALVVGDIPPLAFAAAEAAGTPSIALGNFTWDWIYEGYRRWMHGRDGLVPAIRQAYAKASVALRLPMHGGFEPFRHVRDIPFIARRSQRDPGDTRRALGLPEQTRLVLLSFGGYGLAHVDFSRLAELRGYTVIVTADIGANRRGSADESSASAAAFPGPVHALGERALYERGYRYEDLVAAVDVVVTKPGYGIIAECVANHTAILYTSRGHFVEYDVLVAEMPRYVRCEFISQDELFGGQWQASLDRLLGTPEVVPNVAVDGAEQAAGIIVESVRQV
jgi:hypothetical protein